MGGQTVEEPCKSAPVLTRVVGCELLFFFSFFSFFYAVFGIFRSVETLPSFY